MSNAIQVPPISPVVARPPIKRVNSNAVAAVPAGAAVAPTPQTSQADTAAAVQPVVTVEPTTHLTITRDDNANTFVYRSIDSKTGEVVWQYPVEQVLRMAQRFREVEGLDQHAVDKKV